VEARSIDSELIQSRYRLTRQRVAVLGAIREGTHQSAEDIFARVRAELPGISLGTVYRTLDILRGIGLVTVFSLPGSAARYERGSGDHHHIVCSDCKTILDIRTDRLGAIAADLANDAGYAEIGYALTIVGRCQECRAVR